MTTNTTATKAGHLLDWRELAPVAALLRTHECFADDEDTDIGRDKLDALTAFGWLEKVGRAKWMITALGERIVDRALTTPPAEPASAAEDAKPAAWVTPLHYGEQVTFYKPPAPAPGEDDEWYCYPLFRHPAPSACGVADSAAEGCLCQGCGNRYRGDLEVPDDVWLNGTAGGCNIVTYNGEDVVGVGYIANDNAREQVIADHNARLDAQSADTPSDDHEYACLRVVYEAARRYLRNEGVCKASELAQYRDNLCDAIEEVKLIDGGQYEPDANTPSEAVRFVETLSLFDPARMPERDAEDGDVSHPDLDLRCWYDGNPEEEAPIARDSFKALGFEIQRVDREDELGEVVEDGDDETCGGLYDKGGGFASWNPTIPDGDGWQLIAIYDSEDGPTSLFIRRIAPLESASRPQPARGEVSDAEIEAAFDFGKAIERVFNMGQKYWQEGDSESYSENRRSVATLEKFREFKAEFLAALEAAARVRADHFVDANKIEGDAK